MLEHHYRELLRYFTRKSGNADTAADLVQEAYARVLTLQDKGTLVLQPRALLYRVGRNLLTNLATRRLAEERVLEALALVNAGTTSTLEEVVSARQQLDRLMDLLARMPRKRRDAFILVRVHGMTYAEAARHMAISEIAIERHLARALLDCAGYPS